MLIIHLSQAQDASQAGGKAANLARALSAGFNCPEGWVITRQALSLFLAQHQLQEPVQALLSGYPQLEWREREQRFSELRGQILSLPVPPALEDAFTPVVQRLLEISPFGVAVRSSGMCEDLENASFAGVYETRLGVTDSSGFWRSVVSCWSSAWSPQAAAYAAKMGLTLALDGMAVLVQPLLPSSASGVIFTADPLTGNPWRFILNATFGLAEKLVAGSAPADRFELAWDTGVILSRQIVEKTTALLASPGGPREEPLLIEQRMAPALSDDQASQIAQLALAVDRAFDHRIDLEWAFVGAPLYLLQARPLTAMPVFFPHQLSSDEAQETWIPYLSSWGTLNPQEQLVAPFSQHRWQLELWSRHLTPGDAFPHRHGLERDFNGYRYTTGWR